MATRRRSSATATAPKAPAKKRASRSKSKVTSTTKVVQINKSQPLPVIVTEEPKVDVKVDTNQPQIAPPKPNLSFDDYVADFNSRWAIHQYEVKALWIDLVKGYNLVTPFAKQSVTYVKDSYKRAFN